MIIQTPLAIQMQSGNILHDIINTTLDNLNNAGDKKMVKTTQTNKSKFQDLYWFINNNYNENENYAGLCIMSLNMSFGNIRFDLFNIDPENWKKNSAIFKNSTSDMSAAIYPASMFYVKSLMNGESHNCVEQLVSPYENKDWQNELSTCVVSKNNDNYELSIIQEYKKAKPTLKYLFKDKQRDMFEHALNYCTGYGQQLSGLFQIMCR